MLLSFLVFLDGKPSTAVLSLFSYWPLSGAAPELGVDECSSYCKAIPLLPSSPRVRLEIGWQSLFAKIKIKSRKASSAELT